MSMHPTRNLFKEFPNRIYLETGAWLGDSIHLALDAGFQEIHSIELDLEKVEHCRQLFADKPVSIYHGDSAIMLWEVIKDIKEPITFWLDSHSQLLEDEPETANPFPLLKELEQIGRHTIKTHTIIIDDFLFMSHPNITGFTKKDIELAIQWINHEYWIGYYSNPIRNNILVAHV